MTRQSIHWGRLPCRERQHLEEIISNIKSVDFVNTSNSNVNKFPLDEEDEEVYLRINKPRVERPKTCALISPKTKKPTTQEFKGATRLEVNKDKIYEIRPNELLRLFDTTLELINERTVEKEIIKENVTFKKRVKLVGKKEVEFIDFNDNTYRIHFNSTKEAKLLVETPDSKNISWWQLHKLLKKRSSKDVLESKGIIKNEPIFGNTLEELCNKDNPVPEVIVRIVKLIEEPENIRSVGIYRASGNLAEIQKIRFGINDKKYEILNNYKYDVDVLTGTLKFFIRELKEPLISFEVYKELSKVIVGPLADRSQIGAIIDNLPRYHRQTLLYLIQHLLNVCQFKDTNKMDFHNMAICWGPTLITAPESCLDLVLQTNEFVKITENLLIYYSQNITDQKLDEPVNDFIYSIIWKLTSIIEKDITEEGIYRKSGSNVKIEFIMNLIDEKRNIDELDNYETNVHEICCVLKKYIANIRKLIVPDEFFQEYCRIYDNVESQQVNSLIKKQHLTSEVQRLLSGLPQRNILELLFTHLQNVARYSQQNKLSRDILRSIWTTTLVGSTGDVQNYHEKLPKYQNLFEILMNLNTGLKKKSFSIYENVPDDIDHENDEKISTKL